MQIPQLFNLHLNLNPDALHQHYNQRSPSNKLYNQQRTPSHTDRGNYYYNSQNDHKISYSGTKKEQLNFLSSYQNYKACKISEQNQKDLSNKVKSISNYEQDRNISSSTVLEQLIKNMNQRITKTQQKIEKLKINEKSFVKRNQMKDLILIIKEHRQQNQQINKKTGKDLEKVRQKVKNLYENLQKNFVAKPEFELKLQKWKLKEYLANSTQYKKSTIDINEQLSTKIEEIKLHSNSEIQQIKDWCCNKIKELQTPNVFHDEINRFPMKLFRSNKFSDKFYNFQYKQIISQNQILKEQPNHFKNTNLAEDKIDSHQKKENIFGHSSKQTQQMVLTSCTYYIDGEGYLLDSDKCYLLTSNSQQAKLTNDDIAKLKKYKILEEKMEF